MGQKQDKEGPHKECRALLRHLEGSQHCTNDNLPQTIMTKIVRRKEKRRRGMPKKRWLDNTREDMKEYNVTVKAMAEIEVHGT